MKLIYVFLTIIAINYSDFWSFALILIDFKNQIHLKIKGIIIWNMRFIWIVPLFSTLTVIKLIEIIYNLIKIFEVLKKVLYNL